MPSADGLVSCIVKSLVKFPSFTGVVQNPLPDCPPGVVLVNRNRVPFNTAFPFNCIPVPVIPPLKLICPLPPPCMVITDVAVPLAFAFGACAIAFTVVVALTWNDPLYVVDPLVGWLPSSV